jgi:hypothetical protein
MTRLILSNVFRFIALIILQVLVLNYVYLGGYVLPFVYILGVLMLPTNFGKIPTLLVAFVAGMLVDLFCNIPGFHTFTCTMMAMARIVFGDRMLTQGDPDAVIEAPSVREVPFQTFMGYAFLMSLVYCVTYGLLEAFSFGNFWMTLLSMVINTVVTWVLILLCQLLVFPQKK